MPARILVTGAAGFVAGSVIAQAPEACEVHAQSRGPALLERPGLVWHTLDLCDADALERVFDEAKPDAVIHPAAIAAIDYCETHRDEAQRVNADATRTLARLCRDAGAKFVYCSTDTVFDGEKGLYTEQDPPGPLNFYAETKVRGERAALDEAGACVVARLSLVMGLPVLGAGNSFLSSMMDKFKAGETVGVPADEIRTPLDVITAGRALLELAGNDFTGLIHLAGNDRINRFEMVRRIAEHLGYPAGLVTPSDPSGIPGRAPRPLDASMDNALARRVLETPMRGVIDGLELVLEMNRSQGNDPS